MFPDGWLSYEKNVFNVISTNIAYYSTPKATHEICINYTNSIAASCRICTLKHIWSKKVNFD